MKFDIPICLSLLFFAANSVMHLSTQKFTNITKALIMPSILLCCLCTGKKVPLILVCAIAASWLGDILLERSGYKWFTAGGLAFLTSLLLYGLSYVPSISFSSLPVVAVVAAAVIYGSLAANTIRRIRKDTPEKMNIPLLMYLFGNAFMNMLAFMQMLSCRDTVSIVIYIGAVCFFISDNLLFTECFDRKKPNLFFPVMFTYICGEFLISMGSVMRI